MNVKKILEAKKGQKLFLLGNEAAVRGAFEGGVSFVSTYPGTPSSEIGDVFSKLAKKAGVYFEFSTNEKVALENSAAADNVCHHAAAWMRPMRLPRQSHLSLPMQPTTLFWQHLPQGTHR